MNIIQFFLTCILDKNTKKVQNLANGLMKSNSYSRQVY